MLSIRMALLALISFVPLAGESAAAPPERPPTGPEAWVKIVATASQPSDGSAIRQRAFDGRDQTAYRSRGAAKAGDQLTFTFDGPAAARGVSLVTGGADGGDVLEAGSIEVSEDGSKFEPVATTDARGQARADLGGRAIRAVRVRVDRDLGHPLVVREFAVDSERIRPFRHPVEFAIDGREAPEQQAVMEGGARLCEQWYDTLNDVLTLGEANPPDRITLTLRRNIRYAALAYPDRGAIEANPDHYARYPADLGSLVHEAIHIIQAYPGYGSSGRPTWLVEGVDDYIRYFVFEPGTARPFSAREARFDGSYSITATFLDFVARTYDKQLIPKLDRKLRSGTYNASAFRELTGKTLAQLNDEWRVSRGLPPAFHGTHAGPISTEKGAPAGELAGGGRGEEFRDEARGRLMRVMVWGGSWVDSIECTYTDGRVEAPGGRHGGDGGDEHEVALEPGESIVGISGNVLKSGDAWTTICNLKIRTNRRTIGPIGSLRQGEAFTLDAPDGQEICGFRGRNDQYVRAIGLICRPIP